MAQVFTVPLMTFALRLLCVAKAQTCTVGDHADSSRFGSDFVYGLFPSGQYNNYAGDYGSFLQTNQSSGTTFTAARPAMSASGDFSISAGMPTRFKLTYTASSTVTRSTGIHDGTLRISLDNHLKIYLFGSNMNEGIYGATSAIPLEFLGQEYFAFVRAGPGLGQVIISSTGETTFVRITPNGPFTYNGVTYSSPFSDLEVEIPAWYQMIITTSSNDFTGSRILANKSVSVVSGSACASTSTINCDYAIEQLLPYDKWGTNFNIPPLIGGVDGYYVLVTAGRDDTNINVDGTLVSLSQGQTESREVTSNTITRITSDKPIQVVQILKDAASMVVIPPEEQYTVKNTYVRVTGADTIGFYFTHYFTIVAPCASSSGFSITYTAPGDSTYIASMLSYTSNGDMCAYAYQGSQAYTYTITQSDSNGAFFVVNYGRYNIAGYAYIGGQKFETQRCLDYHTIIYGSDETTTSKATTAPTTTTAQTTTAQTTTAQTTTAQTTTAQTTTAQTTTAQTTAEATTTTQPQPIPVPLDPTTQVMTTSTDSPTTTEATTSQPSTETVETTSLTTNSIGPARKSSSTYSLRFIDKTVAASKQIQTVEGPTTQVRCAQQCMSTENCETFTWVAADSHCVLSGSLDDANDLVQEPGVSVFVRS